MQPIVWGVSQKAAWHSTILRHYNIRQAAHARQLRLLLCPLACLRQQIGAALPAVLEHLLGSGPFCGSVSSTLTTCTQAQP